MELVDKAIKTVCPPADELSVIVNDVKCQECDLSFHNVSRLRMHVLKIHQRKNLEKIIKQEIRYHCPEISCIYSTKSKRHFTTMKYLKQHYLKVHAAKTFACSTLQCNKSFSTEAARQAHHRICGVQFTCDKCLKIFGSYEALVTHAKRTNHDLEKKYKLALVGMKRGNLQPQTPVSSSPLLRSPLTPQPMLLQITTQKIHTPVSILPRSLEIRDKIGFDVAVQTDIIKQRNKRTTIGPSKLSKQRESRQTQTHTLTKEKNHRKTVETQTINAASASAAAVLDKRKMSKKNPTISHQKEKDTYNVAVINENLSNQHFFPNSPLQLQHNVQLQDCFWEDKTTSLGTQTSPEKEDLLEGFTTSSDNITGADPMLTVQNFPEKFTQTESAYSSADNYRRDRHASTFFDTDVVLSSSDTETQTSENFHNIEQLLYSNTCTQTCNDILPSDLGLSDIQTQTAWPELEDDTLPDSVSASTTSHTSLFTSTETQTRDMYSCRATPYCTNIPSCRSWFLNNRTSHTETQTDLLSIFDDEFQ